ncbi:MAG: metal ABC transporter permease [SAR324 cluster bacterium]|nr:metal ABC transporter permease [SAR324 cluster bacterium]MCH8885227.1 metal ABC transporter permease [SAR324 cluster bacterium]
MLLEGFMLRALAGGIGIALVAGPLGCFVVWRRMAYFGDALAHGALLGVALGFALEVDPNLTTLAAFVLFALILTGLQGRQELATDTLLGILSHGALAMGLVAVSFMDPLRVDLMGYLLGDILSVSVVDLAWIFGGGALVLVVLAALWTNLLTMAVHEELARAEGVPVAAMRLVLMMLMSVVILLAMKIVGILLITALLIVPAATARHFARTPETMALLAAMFGGMAVLGGLFASLTWDTPSGPSIVAAAVLLFSVSALARGLVQR